jgi:hypothetical protein
VGHLPAPAEGDEDLFAVPAADAPRGYVPEEEEGYDAGLDSLSGIGAEEEEMNRSEQDRPQYQPPTAARRPTAAAPSAVADLLQGNTRLVVGGAAALLGLIVLCVAAALLLRNTPAAPTLPTPTPVGAACFPPSNACIQGRWKQVWESDGGLAVFGLPLNPPRQVGSIQVQDFQRFRLEYHPENKAPYDILFANLGTELYHATGGKDAPAAQSTAPGCKWFDDVKHNVCGDFLTYWTTHGRILGAGNPEAASLALFGTPLDEARQTTVNGKQLTVQWFQKARFELHPDEKPEFRVQLGLLGAEAAAAGK